VTYAAPAAAPAAPAAPAGKQPAGQKKGQEAEEKEKEEEARARAPATVVVKAPADVVLKVNGKVTRRRATKETFLTPALRPGRTYSYLFRAEAKRDGETVVRTRRIVVRAGQRSVVDFSELSAPAASGVARVTILVPARAKLFANGVAVGTASAKRTFETPELAGGRTYQYEFRADLERDGRVESLSRRVSVEPGKEVTVDFRERAAVAAR
jgi:uncharacterized protein (TIGR03000 family)